MSVLGVDLPADLAIWTLTSILHVKFGKYGALIFEICYCHLEGVLGCFRVLRGCHIWHHSTMLTDCLLPYLLRNKKKFPPFSQGIQNGCQMHPIIYIQWCIAIVVGFLGDVAKFKLILTMRCQYEGIDLPADLEVDLPNFNSSSPLELSTWRGGVTSVSWSVHMNSHSRNVNLLFLTTRCHYCE